MKLTRILVGIDFSEQASAALAQAEVLAKSHSAELVLVHAMGITEGGLYVYDVSGRHDEPWKRYVRQHMDGTRQELMVLADAARSGGIRVAHHLATGFADEALIDEAKARNADLVVVGTHGRTGLDRFLIGSVAERVTRLAPCHVLVARQATPPEPPRRVLVATDFSPAAERAVALALDVVARGGAVTLLHCWQLPNLGEEYAPDWMQQDTITDAERRGRQQVDALGREGVELDFALTNAEPARGILARLGSERFDLVVVGSHGRRGLRRALLGSVAERIVRHAPVSVLVAREREA